MTKKYIQLPITEETLEDHSEKLFKITFIVDRVLTKFNKFKDSNPRFTNEELNSMKDILTKCLIMTADLSTHVDEIKPALYDHYNMTYLQSPALGKKLYYDHFFKLHKPYDKVKKMVWNSFDLISHYRQVHKI